MPSRIKMNGSNNTNKGLVAKASISIDAPVGRVWNALTDPEVIKQYMFGTTVVSRWKRGSPIVWKGKWQGKKYEDKGAILELEPERLIQYSHFSSLSGKPDLPENYHTVTIKLMDTDAGGTIVSLIQDNNETDEEREDSEKNWKIMLETLRNILEYCARASCCMRTTF